TATRYTEWFKSKLCKKRKNTPLQSWCRARLVASLSPVYQERVKTTQSQARIHHQGDRDDVVLNTAQMQDALYLETFRIDALPRNLEMVVHESAAKEMSLRQGSKGRTSAPALPSVTAARPIPMAARPARMTLPSGARLPSHSSVQIHHPGSPHGSSSLSQI
ncbi:unnamed protein product, partial [Mycena citricolor]